MAATLRKVVKAEYADSLLAGIAPSKLVVYANRAAMATRTPLLSDTQIERFGKTRASPLIVQVPPSDVPTTKRKWFQLVDAAGKALTKMHYVSVDVPFVAGLRDAVKTKNADSRHLAGIMASDLVIYANRSAMVAKTPLDEDVSIDSADNSCQHPFIVQVPRGIPPFTVLENADLFTNECGSLMTWEVGVAHEIKLIHEFMEPLGGCTKKGTIFWRWEEQQLVALLMSGWFPETCSEKINVLAGKKSIVLGSPGVGKSTLLCLLAFYVVLKYKKNVLVYRRLLNTDIESALLYLGWEQDRVVYFSIPDCTPEEAIKIRKSMGASVSLWLDGFVYKNVPYGLGAFAVLATSQQVDLKSQAGEHAYCCLLPCWRRDDLFTLGRTLFRYDPLEMEDRFFYSGGSVRDFSALTVDVIEDVITHAVRKVNDPENLLSSAGFVSSGDGQVDRLRHTFLTNDVEEGVNPRDKLRREKYWEQVVDSELAVALLSMRMRSDALYRIFQWARRSDYASLAGCVFEMYSHYLAGDGMLKLFVSEYNPSSGYPEHFQPLPLQKGLAECSGRKGDYVKALTSWRDAKGKSYWVPKDRQFPNVDSIVKLAPKSAASKPSSTPSTTTAALAEKCDVAYLQITIAATHTIQSQSLVELNKIFKSPVSSTPGNTERDHLMEAVETETAATVDDAVAVPMDTDETEESPATTTTSDAVADMQPPIYIAVCPDEKACKQLTLTLNVTNSRRQCQLFVGYFEHASAALRLAAARNLISQAYLGVRAARKSSSQQQTLVSWKQADLDVNKWSKTATRADDKVFGLFVHPQLPEDVVVVHENAQFECYDDALTRVLDSSAMEDASEADGTVVWASLASSHRNPAKGSLLLSLLVQSSSDASQHELMVFRIVPSKERRDARVAATLLARHSLPASCHGAIASCAFHAETLSYSVVLASGEWHMVYFRHDAMSSSIEFTTVKKITTFSPDLSEEDDSTSPVQKRRKLSNAGSASSSSAQFVAGGVGPFSYLVVASPLVPQKLIGWDSKFGVQVVSAEVKADKDGDASVPLPTNIGHIRSLVSSLHGETVVAAYDHAVFLLHVKNKHSTLASVLGVYTNTTKRNVVDTPALPNSAINWGDVASDKVDLDQWHHTLCSDDVHEQQLISELVDATAKISTASFQKKFDAAVQKLGGMEELSYRFLMATTRRCLESADKVPLWGPLKTLIETKRLSSRALPSLLPTLMKHSQFELLELAITHLADLDERAIVRLLRFFIRKSETKALASYVHKKIATSTTTPCERFIVALLGLPTNSVFLHHAIRELQLSEVLLLLAVCKKFFYGIEHTALVDDVSAFFTPLPSATQFCAWICALLDAHVSQLVLTASKETKVAAALEQLDAIVQTQLASCDRFEGVQSVLGNFLSGMNLAQAHGIPDYSIKEFTF